MQMATQTMSDLSLSVLIVLRATEDLGKAVDDISLVLKDSHAAMQLAMKIYMKHSNTSQFFLFGFNFMKAITNSCCPRTSSASRISPSSNIFGITKIIMSTRWTSRRTRHRSTVRRSQWRQSPRQRQASVESGWENWKTEFCLLSWNITNLKLYQVSGTYSKLWRILRCNRGQGDLGHLKISIRESCVNIGSSTSSWPRWSSARTSSQWWPWSSNILVLGFWFCFECPSTRPRPRSRSAVSMSTQGVHRASLLENIFVGLLSRLQRTYAFL